jgi:GT2 family glycosyltransferase
MRGAATLDGSVKSRAVPLVSAVVSTRDRDTSLVRAVETILSNDYPNFELIVVDQSEGDATEHALRRFWPERRLRYVRTEGRGLARGLNFGVTRASGEIYAFTDDDCEVEPDWLRALVDAFSANERIGVVFGNVVPGEHDPNLGFIPAYVRSEPFLAHSIQDKHEAEGIGACMAVRRSVWQALRGFDDAFGAGAEFRSAADLDLSILALGFFAAIRRPIDNSGHYVST